MTQTNSNSPNQSTKTVVHISQSPKSSRSEVPRGQRLSGTQNELVEQLKAIVATGESKEEIVNLILELLVVRTSALAACWYEQAGINDPELVESRFSNASIEKANVREIIEEGVKQSLEAGTTTLLDSKKMHGAATISTPITVNDTTRATLALFFHDLKTDGAELALISQLVATNFDLWRGKEHLTQMNFEVRSTSAVLELVNKIEESESTREASFTIANLLKELVRCEEVAVGLKNNQQIGCRLMALSSRADFDKHSETARAYRASFDEAIVKQSLTSFPAIHETARNLTLSHKKLVETIRCETAVTIPISNNKLEFIGAITFSGKRRLLRDPSFLNLANAMSHPIGSSLGVVKQIEGGPLKRFIRSVVDRKMTKPIWAVAGLLTLSLLALLVPVNYQVSCDCTAEPIMRRFSVAPHDGLLENTFVQPGDIVEQGELIAQMDGREIRVKLASIYADRLKATKKRDAHSARQEVPDMLMAEYERQRLDNEAKILEERQQNLRIESPVEGIVLTGSVDRKQNYPVNEGQELYEIAPLSPLRIEVAIPADEVMHAKVGQRVKVRFDGFGLGITEGEIRQIRARSEIREEQNVFVAEVLLENEDRIIRPGMQGTARIVGSKRSLGWCIFHRPWERFVTAIGF